MTSRTTTRSQTRWVSALIAVAGQWAALGLVGIATPQAALAVNACLGQSFTANTVNATCTVADGETVQFDLETGFGGAGASLNASPGGQGGLGIRVRGTYTNTSGGTETLTVTVGVVGTAGNQAGQDGAGATDDSIAVGATTIAYATGGQGGVAASVGGPGANGADGVLVIPNPSPADWSVRPFGITPQIAFSVPTPPTPTPTPVYVPDAPTKVSASAGNAAATVQWSAPKYTGSFPITHYQVKSSPGSNVCLAAAPALTCEVTGLTNGTVYTFTVSALNGAGWGPASEASNVVTPAKKSIVITGSRDGSLIKVVGRTTGLVGTQLTPWVRLSGEPSHEAGTGLRVVTAEGTFAWKRQTGRSGDVYFESGDIRSNVVVFRAR